LKLIIQIPCFNEEAQLPATPADLPRTPIVDGRADMVVGDREVMTIEASQTSVPDTTSSLRAYNRAAASRWDTDGS